MYKLTCRAQQHSLLYSQSRYSRCTYCVGCVHPPIVVEPWLLMAHRRSATACVLSVATWHKIQSYLQMVATYPGLRGVQARPDCEPRPASPSAGPRATWWEVRGLLKPDVAGLSEFRKIWSMGQDKAFVWKSNWKQIQLAPKVGGTGPQGIIRVWQTMWARVWSLQYGARLPALWLCGLRVLKKHSSLCQHFCLAESCPQALTLMPGNSVPPYMSLVLFNLLPLCWSSEQVNLSESVHGPFKKNF